MNDQAQGTGMQWRGDLFLRATAPEGSSSAMPGAVAVYAHPDDECVALGARLGRFGSAFLVHVTDGAPQNGEDSKAYGFSQLEDYRQARGLEFEAALAVAGIPHVRRTCLNVPDQKASLCLAKLASSVFEILSHERPEVVFTHPYEGGHPDHDACSFAVHAAVKRMRHEQRNAPMIIEGASYHLGRAGIETGCFLRTPLSPLERRYELSPAEQERKRSLFSCFHTQQGTLQYFPVAWESFRVAPEYDFLQPPHTPPVFYDNYDWGMTSTRFAVLAAQAQAEIWGKRVEAA